MDNNNVIKGIILLIVMVAIFAILILSKSKNDDEVKIELVNNYSNFFTVDDCVNRYINYISDEESEKLMNVLNKEYIKDNNININNVLNILDNVNLRGSNTIFKAKKMYQKILNTNTIEYYVYGKLIKDNLDEDELISDYYIIVKINKNNNSFYITPYDGKIFKEGIYEK